MQGSLYTDEDRRTVVIAYQTLGNMREIERRYGIPQSTISDWKASQWWDDLAVQVRSELQDEITAGLTRTLQSSLAGIEDRLANGDVVICKGEPHRVPVRCRDLAVTSSILFQQRQLLLRQPTAIREDSLGGFAKALVEALRSQRSIDGTAERVKEGECRISDVMSNDSEHGSTAT